MTQLLRVLAYSAVGLFWTAMVFLSGVSGLVAIFTLVWVWVASIAVGFIADHAMARGTPSSTTIVCAAIMSLLVPLIILYGCRNPTTWGANTAGQPTSPQQGNGLLRMPLPKKPIERSGQRVEADTGELEGVAAENLDTGVEIGRNEAMGAIGNKVDAIARAVGVDPSTGRVTTVVQSSGRKLPVVVKTSEHTWEVKFHAPGTRVVETLLPLPLGKVYYVSTNGLVENLRVGKVVETKIGNGLTEKKFNFSPAPASELCEDRPLLFRGITNAPNAHLAFLTELVPPGDYTIKIMEPLINPAEGEHSPGVPIDRRYY